MWKYKPPWPQSNTEQQGISNGKYSFILCYWMTVLIKPMEMSLQWEINLHCLRPLRFSVSVSKDINWLLLNDVYGLSNVSPNLEIVINLISQVLLKTKVWVYVLANAVWFKSVYSWSVWPSIGCVHACAAIVTEESKVKQFLKDYEDQEAPSRRNRDRCFQESP